MAAKINKVVNGSVFALRISVSWNECLRSLMSNITDIAIDYRSGDQEDVNFVLNNLSENFDLFDINVSGRTIRDVIIDGSYTASLFSSFMSHLDEYFESPVKMKVLQLDIWDKKENNIILTLTDRDIEY